MKWIAAALFIFTTPAFAGDLMAGMDVCARASTAVRGILGQAADGLNWIDFENRRLRVYVQLENLRWHKTRCVQDTVLRYLPPDVDARELRDSPVMRQILVDLALYRGVVTGARANARCGYASARACTHEDVAEDLHKQVLIAALDAVIADLAHALETPGTLREVAFNRLNEIEKRIQFIEAQRSH